MSATNTSDLDYCHQNNNNNNNLMRHEHVNGTSRFNVSTQTEHDLDCKNGCLSMYIDTCHNQGTDHSDSRENTEDGTKRIIDMENIPSQSKEVHSRSTLNDDNGSTSQSLDNDIVIQEDNDIVIQEDYSPTNNDTNNGMNSTISALPKEVHVSTNTELPGSEQCHTVDIDQRGVICLQLTSDGEHCIVEKTYSFCVDQADTKTKENSIQDTRLANSKQQPVNCPTRIKEPSSNVLSAREEGNGMPERTERERILTYLKPYKCSYCAKRFARQFNLKVHERIHTGVKPYTCIYCNKAFARQGKLTEHERIHTGVKPYKCSICDKVFAVESNLKVHERIHTGVKPYKCTICEKEFTVKCSLKKHERLHTGVRPYECSYCGKTFTVKYSLKEHESVHTGVKPFKCTYCDKAFVRQIRLRKHERIHTGVKPFMCA